MKITTRSADGIPVLELEGRLDAVGAQELERVRRDLDLGKGPGVVLDCSQMPYLSSAGIRVLLSWHQQLTRQSCSLVLAAVPTLPAQVLDMAGFSQVFCLRPTTEEALDFLRQAPSTQAVTHAWDELPSYQRTHGTYRVRPQTEEPADLEVAGDIADIFHDRCRTGDLTVTPFPADRFWLGIGALGRGIDDCREVLGEMVSVGRMIAWVPVHSPETPDYFIPGPGTPLVRGYTLFGASFPAQFSHLVAATPVTKDASLSIDQLYADLFELLPEVTGDSFPLLAAVILARVKDLYTAGIAHSPLGADSASQRATDSWNDAQHSSEPRHRGVTAIIAGVGLNQGGDLSGYDRTALDALFYRHPLHVKDRPRLLHQHGLVFASQARDLLQDNLTAEIGHYVTEGEFQDLCHLDPQTRIEEALIGLVPLREIQRRKEKHLIISMEREAAELSRTHTLLTRKLFADSARIKLYQLGGGFSGSRVFRVASWDRQGKKHMPMVMKLGSLKDTQNEVAAVDRYVKRFILNNAVNLVDYVTEEDEGGLVYNFVGIAGPESRIISFDHYYPKHPPEESCAVLEVVFRRILKAWYQQPMQHDLALYQEYEFLPKHPRVAEWVGNAFSLGPEQEEVTVPEVGWTVINPVWFVRTHVPPHLDQEFPTYQAVVHGDLNTRNILLDEKTNVWLIDFSEAHEGHILSDLVKLEACLKFESFDLESWDDVRAMLELEAALLAPTRLDHIPVYPDVSGRDWPSRIYPMVRTLRELANVLTGLENDPTQYYIGLLYFTLQVLRYPQVTEMTRSYALLSAGRICQLLQSATVH